MFCFFRSRKSKSRDQQASDLFDSKKTRLQLDYEDCDTADIYGLICARRFDEICCLVLAPSDASGTSFKRVGTGRVEESWARDAPEREVLII